MHPAQPISAPATTSRITTIAETHWWVTTLGAPPEARDVAASGPTELGSMFNALAATAARSAPISEEGVAIVTSSQTKCCSSAPRERACVCRIVSQLVAIPKYSAHGLKLLRGLFMSSGPCVMRRLYQAVAEYWEDRNAVSPQTPFLLTITSGSHAAAILATLAEHRANVAADDLLMVLVESLHGTSKRRARTKRDSIQCLLEQLKDQGGVEAYALTSVLAALTVYIGEAARCKEDQGLSPSRAAI